MGGVYFAAEFLLTGGGLVGFALTCFTCGLVSSNKTLSENLSVFLVYFPAKCGGTPPISLAQLVRSCGLALLYRGVRTVQNALSRSLPETENRAACASLHVCVFVGVVISARVFLISRDALTSSYFISASSGPPGHPVGVLSFVPGLVLPPPGSRGPMIKALGK